MGFMYADIEKTTGGNSASADGIVRHSGASKPGMDADRYLSALSTAFPVRCLAVHRRVIDGPDEMNACAPGPSAVEVAGQEGYKPCVTKAS